MKLYLHSVCQAYENMFYNTVLQWQEEFSAEYVKTTFKVTKGD